jgi:O-antigen/teichoic acid export membrane protein
MVLTYSLIVFLSWKKNNIIFQLLLQKKNLGQLIKTGFPIMMLTMTFFLMHNIDKYLIFYLLGSTMTGYYGLAEFITTMMHNVPYGISQVLFPRMMQKFGRTKDKKQIEEYFTIPMQLLTFATPIALGLIFINMEWLLTLALPKYLPSLLTIKILVLGIFFSAIMKTPLDIIILMNKQKVTLIIQFIILFLGAVADYFVIKAGYGISGVAMVTTLTFCVSAIIMVAYASKLLEYPVQKTSFEISKLLGSFVYLLVILFLSTSASALGVSPMYSILLTNLFFIILIIPYILLLNKNDLLKKIFQSLRRGT